MKSSNTIKDKINNRNGANSLEYFQRGLIVLEKQDLDPNVRTPAHMTLWSPPYMSEHVRTYQLTQLSALAMFKHQYTMSIYT